MIRSDLVQKLAPIRAPEDLEEAFSNYQDRHWVSVPGCPPDWRLIFMGFSSIGRVCALAKEKMTSSFEVQAGKLQKQIVVVKHLTDATDFVQHDHNQLLEIIQYLALSGMPWHLAQRWNLLSLQKIRVRVQEMDRDNVRWIPTLFSWFGNQFRPEDLSDSDWIHFELFCWRNQALKGIPWMDLLEDWARGDEKKTTALNNLKMIFLFTRSRHLFSEQTEPKKIPKASPKKAPVLQMIVVEEPAPLPPRRFTRHAEMLAEKESLKHYLIQRTLSDLERYRLKVPKGQKVEMERLLQGMPQQPSHEAQVQRNCFSLLELADRVEGMLEPINIPKAMNVLDSLFPEEHQKGLFPPGKERALYLFLETALYFSLFHARIKLADESWQELFFSMIALCNPDEKKQLLQQLQTPSNGNSAAPEIFLRLHEAQLLSPFQLISIFLHVLVKEENPAHLTSMETLRFWKLMEEFIGPFQNPDILFCLFCGPPILQQALESLEKFSLIWRSLPKDSLFLPHSYFDEQDKLVKEVASGLALEASRKTLVESLDLATLQKEPVYVPTLLQFKGFQTATEETSGTVIPLSKEIKLSQPGHLHCVSKWNYRTVGTPRNSKTLASLECSLFFLDRLRCVSFEIDLPEFLHVELFQDRYSANLVSLFRCLIFAFSPERYRENQEEHSMAIQTSDKPLEIRGKIIEALQKLHWVQALTEFTYFIDPKPDQTDPERLRQAIALFQFIYQLKMAFRQALSVKKGYDRIEALPYNQGWQFCSQRHPNFPISELFRSDCQPIVDQLYRSIQARKEATQEFKLSNKEISLRVETSFHAPLIRLDFRAAFKDKEEISDHIQWPQSFPEAQSKELIFLILCKVVFHKQLH